MGGCFSNGLFLSRNLSAPSLKHALGQGWRTWAFQMYMNNSSHQPWPLAVLAGSEGNCSSRTSGGARFAIPGLKTKIPVEKNGDCSLLKCGMEERYVHIALFSRERQK